MDWEEATAGGLYPGASGREIYRRSLVFLVIPGAVIPITFTVLSIIDGSESEVLTFWMPVIALGVTAALWLPLRGGVLSPQIGLWGVDHYMFPIVKPMVEPTFMEIVIEDLRKAGHSVRDDPSWKPYTGRHEQQKEVLSRHLVGENGRQLILAAVNKGSGVTANYVTGERYHIVVINPISKRFDINEDAVVSSVARTLFIVGEREGWSKHWLEAIG